MARHAPGKPQTWVWSDTGFTCISYKPLSRYTLNELEAVKEVDKGGLLRGVVWHDETLLCQKFHWLSYVQHLLRTVQIEMVTDEDMVFFELWFWPASTDTTRRAQA